MGRNSFGHEEHGWSIWSGVAVSPEVASELKRAKQVQDAIRRADEHKAIVSSGTAETAATSLQKNSCCADWSGPILQLFEWDELTHDQASTDAHQDSEARERKAAVHRRLMARGAFRRLACLPEDWRAQLDGIEVRFPNFSGVVDYLRAMFAVAEHGTKTPAPDPILLNGPPGVGKSMFAECLAQFFGCGYRRLNMENAQTNAQLVGSDEFWANSKTGAVFEVLVEGDYANPVFLLDEVDKVRGRPEYDPLGALYGLLEPGTAKCFRDQSMPRIGIDASRIYWLLTANEANALPGPILSRVRRFDIRPPTPEQAIAILNSIFESLQCEMGLPTELQPLSPDVSAVLGQMAPRRQRQILREVIGRALYAGRDEITADDCRLPIAAEEIERRIGF